MLRFVAGFLLAIALGAQGREIVILDTDSGLFGDDGAALVMLLRRAAPRGLGTLSSSPARAG